MPINSNNMSPAVSDLMQNLACPVCLELNIAVTICGNGHSLCTTCVSAWAIARKCPTCRADWTAPTYNVAANSILRQLGVEDAAPLPRSPARRKVSPLAPPGAPARPRQDPKADAEARADRAVEAIRHIVLSDDE
jgi:hypothetical protein